LTLLGWLRCRLVGRQQRLSLLRLRARQGIRSGWTRVDGARARPVAELAGPQGTLDRLKGCRLAVVPRVLGEGLVREAPTGQEGIRTGLRALLLVVDVLGQMPWIRLRLSPPRPVVTAAGGTREGRGLFPLRPLTPCCK
jgi:hypothetical protein